MTTKISTAFLSVFFSLFMSFNLMAQSNDQIQTTTKAKVDVFYFHLNSRCITCKTVEAEAKKDVKELFGDDVSFTSINLDEAAGEAKGKELGVNSQTLLVVKGDKKINLTNDGFMYARTNPKKFKKIIEDKIKPLL
jgi:hypothetical protein